MSNYFIGLFILIFGGFISCLFKNIFKTKILSIFGLLSSVLCLMPAINTVISGTTVSQDIYFNPIFGNVNFAIDPLSAFFIIVISIMSLTGIIYSNGYLKPYIENGKNINAHLIFLSMLICAMQLVVTCQNVLMFLIFWEIMSLSSFFLVIFENEKKEVLQAGIKYLVFMHVSVLFIIASFAICAIHAGSFDFNTISTIFENNSKLANTVFILAFLGFGTKAGFVPFHNWLPDAHPAAPSHVSAIMSGVMIKTGIYGILRMLILIGIPSKTISYAVLIIAILSGLYGVLYAITQHDIKRLLAYHSIENIGIIGIGIGIGMLGLAYGNNLIAFLGFAGGILHVLNHSIFKELLFLGAGNLYIKSHTRNIEELGGLVKSMPKTALLFLIASVSICGLPPFNGFISEFLIYFGIINGLTLHHFISAITMMFALAGLALIGTMAILCFTKAFGVIFLGSPRSTHAKNVKSDTEFSMLLPMSVLASFTILIGIFPQFAINLVSKPAEILIGNTITISNSVQNLLQQISVFAIIFLLITSLLAVLKYKFAKNRIEKYETWGCGYNMPNERMQYTACSYAKPFVVVLRPLFKKVFDVVRPKKLFPKEAHYHSHIDDIEEAYFINPLVKFDEYFLSKFEKLQDGNIQTYIQYGIGFLIILLIGCWFI